ncbi:MAG: DUF523 domain-containing protein, partial [Candidatus Bathyarchaeota archaeon]
RGGLVPLCPEQLGGLPTPRPSSRIVDGNAYDVLDGRARVSNERDEDVTEEFVRGAREVLSIAEVLNVEAAILESRSPSCGCGSVYDETSEEASEGDGVLTALLKRKGIRVVPR